MRLPWLLLLLLLCCNAAYGQQQLVVVVADNWHSTTATLRTYQRQQGQWQPGPVTTPVVLGRQGLAWGLGLYPTAPLTPSKIEGDGKTPAGIFTLGTAFGYAAKATTAMPYLAASASDYCVDVPASAFYNQLVDSAVAGRVAVRGASEPLRLDLHRAGDQRYRLALVVNHNPDNSPGAGSCIFLHQWADSHTYTAGCTAMPGEALNTLLAWLKPAYQPRLVVLPRQAYQQLASHWQLPPLP
ncbi:L,D-transpeptidase [Gallaecimonas sp. GXIMD1310]|uniref:L,D-transpeptidase family protein n=1 Tax=Gallaecimonas sp. GXIMD1310 TaxID=3131926 RepID=UPI003244CEFA